MEKSFFVMLDEDEKGRSRAFNLPFSPTTDVVHNPPSRLDFYQYTDEEKVIDSLMELLAHKLQSLVADRQATQGKIDNIKAKQAQMFASLSPLRGKGLPPSQLEAWIMPFARATCRLRRLNAEITTVEEEGKVLRAYRDTRVVTP